MKNIDDITQPIALEMQRFEAFFRQTIQADTEPMDTIMRYVLSTKGKRLRPTLALLSAKLLGEPNEQTLRAATFAEMVHSATLIHDDVVDGAELRRGMASVSKHFNNLSAVLAGDYLLAKAMLLLSHPADQAILQEMLQTTAAMSEGELMQGSVGLSYNGSCCNAKPQVQLPQCDTLTDQYLDIITRKTAMLMRSCCAAGALSVGATPEQVQQISVFGLHFGILFQLRDDLLDGENVTQAQALLPICYEKTLQSLEGLPNPEIVEILRELTVFCAERTE